MRRLTTKQFIKKAREIHKNKYDYSLTKYESVRTFVFIICPTHGRFSQLADNHLQGHGCPKCRYNNVPKGPSHYKQLSKEKFIEKAIKVHDHLYDYSEVNYISNKRKIIIICSHHGPFKQLPGSHLQGIGCPRCKFSKGEKEISRILTSFNLYFETQKSFDDCVYKNKLRFDFYLPDFQVLIEYDGKQHFNPDSFNGFPHTDSTKRFEYTKKLDNIKNIYAKQNNLLLIRIPYFVNDIKNFLIEELKSKLIIN